MKFIDIAAVAAAALSSSGGLVAGLALPPRVVVVDPSDFGISVLGGSTFRLNQVPNENFMPMGRGPRSMAKAYAKYGVEIPAELLLILQEILALLGVNVPSAGGGAGAGGNRPGANTTAGANQGEVSATPQLFDVEYLAPVQIGSPPQTLMLNFDTGSSDLWVFSSETPKTMVKGQKLYDITQSSTSRRLTGETWSIRYGDGSSSSGNVYTDVVSIGGVTVQNQAIESATMVSKSFTNDSASSGLVGLAMSTINQVKPTPQKTFFTNAMENLAMPLFTANLKKNSAGNYNFGFIDSTEFTGSVSFVDVNATQGFWQFQAAGFSVGNTTNVALPHQAIADTGTTLLMLPNEIVTAYYAQVRSAQNSPQFGGFVFGCQERLPALTLNIGSYKAVVPGEVINFAPADADTVDKATVCFGGIQSQGNLPFAIYGDVFFKSQFTVFHGGKTQLGFAPKPVA